MPRTLEFANRHGVNRLTGESFTAAVIVELPKSSKKFSDVLTIDGEAVDIPPADANLLIRRLKTVRKLLSPPKSLPVDCTIFSTILCGGQVSARAFKEEAFPYRLTSSYREIVTADNTPKIARQFEPTALGKIGVTDGVERFKPRHMVVPLNPEADLYIHKLGSGDIAITGLKLATELYPSDMAGSVLSSRTV